MLGKCALAIGLLSVMLAAGADAAQPAKSKAKPKAKPQIQRTMAFDGRYSGVMKVNPGLSGPGCHDVQVSDFVINSGVITPASVAPSLQPVFDGFVTDEGFITGHVRLFEATVTFEGRAAPMGMVKVISGGVLDNAAKCSWVVNLTLE